jgi:lipopolysaccharide heptosyltransferase II
MKKKVIGEDFFAKERILVFEVNWLGDVLFSTPAIRAIRKKYPGAYLAALVVPRCREVLFANNYLDEVMVYDEKGKHRGLKGKIRLIRDLRARHFTISYLFKSSLSRTLYLFLAGIKKRIGYGKRRGDFFLTERVMLPKEQLHRADTYYYLVAKDKIPEGERRYDFFISNEDRAFIEDLLKKHHVPLGKQLVVLHVGGNWDLKRWPKVHFARLIDVIKSSFGAEVVISGSFLDHPLAKEIAGLTQAKPFVACGMTTLKQLAALFQKSDLVISADSGPLHIAMAMQANTLALFGPTLPEITGPIGEGDFSVLRNKEISCEVPCYNLECKNNICMSSLSVEQVIEEVEKRGWLKKAV